MKERGKHRQKAPVYRDIHMPSNTSAGFFIAVFSLVLGFAAVWHIWWLAIVGIVGVLATLIGYSFRENDGYYISAEEVRQIEERHAARTETELENA